MKFLFQVSILLLSLCVIKMAVADTYIALGHPANPIKTHKTRHRHKHKKNHIAPTAVTPHPLQSPTKTNTKKFKIRQHHHHYYHHHHTTVKPRTYSPYPILRFTVFPGSLRENITRLVKKTGWNNLVWRLPYDHNCIGSETLSGRGIEDIMKQLLEDYPLQAVFYSANHVIVITSRNVQ